MERRGKLWCGPCSNPLFPSVTSTSVSSWPFQLCSLPDTSTLYPENVHRLAWHVQHVHKHHVCGHERFLIILVSQNQFNWGLNWWPERHACSPRLNITSFLQFTFNYPLLKSVYLNLVKLAFCCSTNKSTVVQHLHCVCLQVAKEFQNSTQALQLIGKSLHPILLSAIENIHQETFSTLTLFITKQGKHEDQQCHHKYWDNDHSCFDSTGLSTEPRTLWGKQES